MAFHRNDLSSLFFEKLLNLTTNTTGFHDWGAASPQIPRDGIIRVPSRNSWFKYSAPGYPSRVG
jgi:hypothetical protein